MGNKRFVHTPFLKYIAVMLCTTAVLSTSVRAAEPLEYVPAVETHLIPSKFVKQTYQIQVMQPAQKRGEKTKFPVVYVTDGNLVFDIFKGTSYIIQQGEAPRFILVGIGYPSDSPFAGSMLRGRDLTFPGYAKLDMKRPVTKEGVPVAEPGTKDFMGADDFQKFIGEELIPFVDKKYATVSGDRTYFGHSAGGGFGLYTLFNKPDLFKRYIISSPGLIFNGESSAGVKYDNYDFALREARKFIDSKKPLTGIRVHMTVGTQEEFQPGYEVWQLTSSFYRMATLMKGAAIPGLDFTAETLAGETHGTVWPVAFIHGVQAVFGTGLWEKPAPLAAVK